MIERFVVIDVNSRSFNLIKLLDTIGGNRIDRQKVADMIDKVPEDVLRTFVAMEYLYWWHHQLSC